MNQTINSKNLDSKFHHLRTMGSAALLGLAISFLLFMGGCGQKGDSDPLLGDIDPLLGEFSFDVPLAYIKRPVDALVTEDEPGNANPRNAYQYRLGPTGETGGNLYVRTFVSINASEYNITANPRGQFPGTAPEYDADGNLTREAGDVADPDVSYDGKKIVFSFRPGDPPDTDPDEQSKWDLWEYEFPVDGDGKIVNIQQGTFSPVISGLAAQNGNDIDPAYLPDGSIVFASDRAQLKAELLQAYPAENITEEPLLTESRNEPAMNLHIMFPGEIITLKQISLNQSHELDPTVISSGKIVYSRWEHASRNDNQSPFPLFQISPNGTGHDVLYGAHSFSDIENGVAAFLQAREAQDGTLVATRMSQFGSYLSGDLVKINYKDFVDENTPRTGSAGKGHVSITKVTPLGGYSAEGRFATPFPLWDDTNRLLVAWAYCEVQDQNGNRELCSLVDNPTNTDEYSPAPPGFGIWMMQANGVTMNPIVLPEEGWSITDPIAIVDRIEMGNYPNARYDFDTTPPACGEDQTLCAATWESGLIKIASVYDTDDISGQGINAVRTPETLTCVDPNNPVDSGTCTGSRTRVSINALQTSAPDARPVRFIRVVGPALIIQDTNSTRMREILGYHVVEPDGSVVMKVPAGRPFSFELVDKLGHRFASHPQTWLQVQTGEVMECNGCHAGHTRTTPLNQGSDGSSFPGSNPTDPMNDPLLPQVGETMAETLDRVSCADEGVAGDVVDGDPGGTGCLYRNLSGDLVFRNIWDDPDGVDPNNGDFAIRYSSINLDLDHIEVPPATVPPLALASPKVVATSIPVMVAGKASFATETDFAQADCINGDWSAKCRIAINYETHIQSIWEKNRWLDPLNTGTESNYPCIRCHRENSRDDPSLENPTTVDVPDGQLSLTRTGSHQTRVNDNIANLFESFLELTQDDDVMLITNNGELAVAQKNVTVPNDLTPDPNDTMTVAVDVDVNECTVVQDNEGNLIFAMVGSDRKKCGSSNAMDRGRGSRNYGYFYNRMTQDLTQAEIDAGMVNHNGMLNQAELKMINEWIEVGRRQYWGDPSDQRDMPAAIPVDYE